MPAVTVRTLQAKKGREPIVMLTAYDAVTAAWGAAGGVDILLVGDSLANTALGHATTLPVTMDEMLHHARAVRRASGETLVVCDMPFLSYQASPDDAVRECGRALKEAGAHAVKLEGGTEIAPLVRRLFLAGIPVMGHLGLQPQRVNAYGGYYVQGRDEAGAESIVDAARALVEAGCFALVLELVPAELAARVAAAVPAPVLGIGAGAACDGQVLVIADLLGMTDGASPKHNRRYAELGSLAAAAVRAYVDDVRAGRFPAKENAP